MGPKVMYIGAQDWRATEVALNMTLVIEVIGFCEVWRLRRKAECRAKWLSMRC